MISKIENSQNNDLIFIWLVDFKNLCIKWFALIKCWLINLKDSQIIK